MAEGFEIDDEIIDPPSDLSSDFVRSFRTIYVYLRSSSFFHVASSPRACIFELFHNYACDVV